MASRISGLRRSGIGNPFSALISFSLRINSARDPFRPTWIGTGQIGLYIFWVTSYIFRSFLVAFVFAGRHYCGTGSCIGPAGHPRGPGGVYESDTRIVDWHEPSYVHLVL